MGDKNPQKKLEEENDETIKRLKYERKRRIMKRVAIAMVAIVIVGILIAAYSFYEASQDTYFRPEGTLNKPDVNWGQMNDSLIVKRVTYENISGYSINKTIGSEKSDSNFKVELREYVANYEYVPGGGPERIDEIASSPLLYVEKIGNNNYEVKELIFKYKFNDYEIEALTGDYINAKNLYFLSTEGNFDGYSDKIEYEWRELHQLRGVNKDAKDIKECGFTFEMDFLMFDDVPFMNHTITLTATLYYGHHTIFGWQDVHSLSADVKIYVVPEG